jgi:hypothetical protein
MGAWLLIVSVYGALYFQTFDGGSWQQNWQHCTEAAQQIGNYYAEELKLAVLVTCAEK